jgi:serine/threonine-protein kinase
MADSRKQAGALQQEQSRDMTGAEPKGLFSDPLVGRTLNGRFKILSVIARGGMGKVYKAEQAPLGRLCALKVLSPKYEGDRDPEFHRRFFLEASTASKLKHPNTVTVYDYGKSEEDLYYIAMEFIEGRTLHRAIRDDGPFDEVRTAHVARQICRSLREAHRLGIVHRDLKPGNVLLVDGGDEGDSVKVLDFGLVKDVSNENAAGEDLTQAGLFMGSPKYMAPEQIMGPEASARISARTDIYALGVVMYEMLCGKVPFDRGAGVATLMAHVHEMPPPMTVHRPDLLLSDVMHEIIRRCLEKDPAKRYTNMDEVLTALKRSGGEDMQAGPSRTSDWSGPQRLSGIRGAPGDALPFPPGHDTDSAIARRSSNPIPPRAAAPSYTPVPVPVRPAPSTADSGFGVRRDSASLGPASHLDSHSSPSITDTLGAAQAPTLPSPDYPPLQPRRGRYLWIAAAVVVVGGGAVLLSATSRSPNDTTGAAPAAAPPVEEPRPATAAPGNAAAPERKVGVESDPAGATVAEGDKLICEQTPCELTFPAGAGPRTITVQKQGFEKALLTVNAADGTVKAKLSALPLNAAPKSGPVPGPAIKQGPARPPQTGGTKDYKDDPYKKNPY